MYSRFRLRPNSPFSCVGQVAANPAYLGWRAWVAAETTPTESRHIDARGRVRWMISYDRSFRTSRTLIDLRGVSRFMPSFVTLNDVVVVIAEDDDDVRFALSVFLVQKGATVFAYSDARAALDAVRTRHPDIVLSDIGLPKRDGFELLQDIRSLDPEQGGGVPVIAVTALEGIANQTETVDSGFRAILRKPFKPDRLLSTVVSTLGPDRTSTIET